MTANRNKIYGIDKNVVYVRFCEDRINPEEVFNDKQLEDFNFIKSIMSDIDKTTNNEWNALIRCIVNIDLKLNYLFEESQSVNKVSYLKKVK